MPLTSLQTLVNRAQSKRALMNVSADDLVVSFDAAIREQMRTIDTPWRLKKGTLRVFSDVLEYPVAADHEDLMFLDTQKAGNDYWEKARFQYTSIQQFYENPEDRNYLATIFQNGTKFLGVRYQSGNNIAPSVMADGANSVNGWSTSGDASNMYLDQVNTHNSGSSIQFSVNNVLGIARIMKTLDNSVSIQSNSISGGGTAGSLTAISNEIMGGTVDGINKIFTLAHIPTLGSQVIFVEGQEMSPGSPINDYVISGLTVTFTNAPTNNPPTANYTYL